jgi:glutamine amidotransferase
MKADVADASRRIAVVDYGIGNLRSVVKAISTVGGDVVLTSDPVEIRSAAKVILPGVGAFGDGKAGLENRNLVQVIEEVVARRIPLLGICLGMQLLFETSYERGEHQGLGILPGRILRFSEDGLKVPQTGWNQFFWEKESPLLRGIESGSYAYFNHGYYCQPAEDGDWLAFTEYGLCYASIVARGSLYGVQFHPEKSQSVGLQILRNFVEVC